MSAQVSTSAPTFQRYDILARNAADIARGLAGAADGRNVQFFIWRRRTVEPKHVAGQKRESQRADGGAAEKLPA